MTDSPTMPIPAIRISPEAMRRLRRQVRADHARQRDLDRATLGQVLDRGEALAIVARMSARPDQTTCEAQTVRELMRRHGLTSSMIRHEQRRLSGSR